MNWSSIFGMLIFSAAGLDFAFFEPDVEKNYGQMCLSLVAFTEARDQGDTGMAAVMQVVLNRTQDASDRWPKSICEVVHQKNQFVGVDSWNYPRHPELIDSIAWQRSLDLAQEIINGNGPPLGSCSKATFFDTGKKKKGLTPVCTLGSHYFYTSDPITISKNEIK